jgi:hypothetical protein
MEYTEPTKKKNYLVFGGDLYARGGGWQDFKFAANTLRECENYLKKFKGDWWQIVDTEKNKLISECWSHSG